MDLLRHAGESQREFVGRMLREHGEVRVFDLVYNAWYDDGTKCSLTRTASVVWSLRHEDGLDIETTGGRGDLAVYVLHDVPRPNPPARGAEVPPQWRCTACRSLPLATPEPVLGGLATGPCPNCGRRAYFKRVAA